MEIGKRTGFTNFGMMPTLITTSLAEDTHYRITQRDGHRGWASPVWVG